VRMGNLIGPFSNRVFYNSLHSAILVASGIFSMIKTVCEWIGLNSRIQGHKIRF
jgi:hypothetical protein